MFKNLIVKIHVSPTGKLYVLLTALVIMLSACGTNQTAPARDQMNQPAPVPNQSESSPHSPQQPQENPNTPSNDSSLQTNDSVQAVKPSGSSGQMAWDALQQLLSPFVGKMVLTADLAISGNDAQYGGEYTMHMMTLHMERPVDGDAANAIAKQLREEGYKDVTSVVSGNGVMIGGYPDDLIKNKKTKVIILQLISSDSNKPNELQATLIVRS